MGDKIRDEAEPQNDHGHGGHHHDGHGEVQVCAFCGQDYEFEMPAQLLEAIRDRRLVTFAGAGVSTETSKVFPSTFYDEIKSELPTDSAPDDFPAVMSAYEKMYGRLKLVGEAIERIRYAETFPAVRSVATRFHTELATIAQVRDIITTNWDGFFEDVCGAIPIVVDGDYAFHNLPDRKVYKIHGSLRNVSTLIATTEDYEETEESLRTSAVGGTLRHLLATQVVVFVGYSLRDSDFRNVYEPLMNGMGKLRPLSYFVGPFDSAEADGYGLHHIKTDGTHFLRSLKRLLVESDDLLPDHVLDRARTVYPLVMEAHHRTSAMNWREHPEIVFSLAYQDGLLDAVNRISARWITGEYTDRRHVYDTFYSYEHLLHVAAERKRFWDAAYIDGYRSGVMLLLLPEDEDVVHLPMYEFFDDPYFLPHDHDDEEDSEQNPVPVGTEASGGEQVDDELNEEKPRPLLTEDELLEYLDGVFDEIEDLQDEAIRLVESMPQGMVPQHTPFLDGVMDPVGAGRPGEHP